MASSEKKETSLVQKILNWFKNQPITAFFIVLGISVIGFASFTNAITDIKDFFNPVSESAQSTIVTEASAPDSVDVTPRVQADKNLFEITVQSDFNSVADLSRYYLLDVGYGRPSNEDIKIEQGIFYFGTPPLKALNFKPFLSFRNAIHLRWKTDDPEACYAFPLWAVPQNSEQDDGYGVGIGGCSGLDFNIEYPNKNNDVHIPEKVSSIFINEPSRWMDGVFWIENVEQVEFRGLVWYVDEPSTYSLYKANLPEWGEENNFTFSFEGYNGEIAVDYLKLVEGEIESYLWFYAPPFASNSDDILDFFNSD